MATVVPPEAGTIARLLRADVPTLRHLPLPDELVMKAGADQYGTWVVGVAKAGEEEGVTQNGCRPDCRTEDAFSCIGHLVCATKIE